MSGFDKDDYLKDLPDPDDPILKSAGTGASGASGSGSQGSAEDCDEQSARSAGQEANMSKENNEGAPSAGSGDIPANSGDTQSARSDESAKGAAEAASQDASNRTSSQEDNSAKAGTPMDSAADKGQSQGDGHGDGAQQSDTDTLTPLGQAKKEAAEYLDALQRERAEFVNFRNRAAKEQERFRQHGIIDVLTALLPALDDIDRIREHGDFDDSFAAVATKIDKAFEKFDVQKFGEKGEDFDPTKHEAVLHKPDPSATKETVDTVVEAGYRIGDRVIRAARVVVVSPKA